VSSNPNPNQQPNNAYGGYGGYSPSNPSDDPYGATSQPQQGYTGPQQNDPNYVYGQQQQYGQQQHQQQQQNAYVPPSSVSSRGRTGGNYSQAPGQRPQAGDQRSRLRALFSYLGLCFTGVYFLLKDRSNRYVSFHAAQSIALFAPLVVLYVVISILATAIGLIPILGGLVVLVLGLVLGIIKFVIVIAWILMMVTSYLGMTIRIPVVSEYADKIMARTSR